MHVNTYVYLHLTLIDLNLNLIQHIHNRHIVLPNICKMQQNMEGRKYEKSASQLSYCEQKLSTDALFRMMLYKFPNLLNMIPPIRRTQFELRQIDH